jgi:hypothetical protein
MCLSWSSKCVASKRDDNSTFFCHHDITISPINVKRLLSHLLMVMWTQLCAGALSFFLSRATRCLSSFFFRSWWHRLFVLWAPALEVGSVGNSIALQVHGKRVCTVVHSSTPSHRMTFFSFSTTRSPLDRLDLRATEWMAEHRKAGHTPEGLRRGR